MPVETRGRLGGIDDLQELLLTGKARQGSIHLSHDLRSALGSALPMPSVSRRCTVTTASPEKPSLPSGMMTNPSAHAAPAIPVPAKEAIGTIRSSPSNLTAQTSTCPMAETIFRAVVISRVR